MALRDNGWVLAAGLLLAAAVQTAAVQAQDAGRATAASGAAASGTKGVCVDAEVNGQRALSYDCLSRQLGPRAAAPEGASQSSSEGLAKQPSNRVGTFNLSTERNRFGSNWGKSATPQRPAPPVAVPPR